MPLPPDAQLREVFEASPVAVLICDEQTVRYANAACAALLGYAGPGEVAALHPVQDVVQPEDREAYAAAIRRLVSGEGGWEQQWLRVSGQDGTQFPAYMRAQAVRYPDQLCAFVTIVDDSALTADRQRLELLGRAVDSVSEAVLVVGGDGMIVYANRAAGLLLGVAASVLTGTDARRLLAEELSRARIEEESWPGGERHTYAELSLRRLTGEVFPAGVTVSVFRDEGDERQLGIVIARDLTEAKRLAEEREWRAKQLAAMLREAHHRIKNSLQVASDLLVLQANATSPETAEALASAATRIRALAAVHGGMSVDEDVTTVHTQALLHSVVSGLRERASGEAKAADLHASLDDLSLSSRVGSALVLIAAELLSGAMQRPGVRSISVQFEARGEDAVLEVAADGGAANSPDTAAFGTRLVRMLAEEQLGGEFTVERSGDQTTAVVRFPLAEDAR